MSSKKTAPSLDVLVVGAHPDDAELMAGGTIAKLARRGRSVGILDVTAGETGTRGSPSVREREAVRAAAILGATLRTNLGLPDGYLDPCAEPTRRALVEAIRALRPRLVITHHEASRHPDHRALVTLVDDACFLAGLARWRARGAAWKPSALLFATAYVDARPAFLVDVSETFELKARAVAAHRSQVAGARRLGDVPDSGRPLLETIRCLDAANGALISRRYAEPFALKAHVPIDDPVGVLS